MGKGQFDDFGRVASDDGEDDPLNTLSARIELVTHRCFIVTPEGTGEEYPYNLTYRDPRAATTD